MYFGIDKIEILTAFKFENDIPYILVRYLWLIFVT